MRAFKLLTTSLLLAVIGLFVWQNLAVFQKPVDFTLDLYIHEQVTWSLSLYTVLIIIGVLGFFIGILGMLKPYFRTRRLLARERQERQQAKTAPVAPPPPVAEQTVAEEAREKTDEG